jgi:hypothetical protein
MKLTIYWKKRSTPDIREKISKRFNIPHYLSVNGETPCEIKDSDLELLQETEKRGFIQIRHKPD